MPGKLKNPRKNAVIFIVGPTASGKTRLAVALAKKIKGEVISADSMQIYKGMDILSQSPSASERRGIRHHLISALDPKKEYSAASFMRLAGRTIKDIIRRGKVPIVAGGSGLYVRALTDGLFPSPKADRVFRRKMEKAVSKRGSPALHARLSKIDPQAASKIHPNDKRRIIRALELHHCTGKTMTELKAQTRGLSGKYDIKIFGLDMPRETLYSRINRRADKMIRQGALAEVKKLKEAKLSQTARAVLGFNELSGYIDGLYDLGTAVDALKTNTRHFAKRQLSWFRSDKRIKWIDITRANTGLVVRKIIMEMP